MAETAPIIEAKDHWPTIHSVVLDVHRRWRRYVELEDLEQEALTWWYGRGQKYLAGYLEDENLVRLRRSLWRFIARYAAAEKAQKVGYLPSDQYRYTPAEVLGLLPVALDPDGVPGSGGVQEGPKPQGNAAEGGDLLAALVDVRRAVAELAEEDIHFLQLLDDVHYDYDRAAVLLGIQDRSAQRRHQRVIERMCRWLNNEENYAA